MPRDTAVRDVMSPDVLTFAPEENVRDAMARLIESGYGGGPVVDADGDVVGMLADDDLIVSEADLHLPTVIVLLGATLEWPSSKKRFDEDVEKALGATVGEVMNDEVVVCGPQDTIEEAATLMHNHDVSRLPVVDDGVLVGLISRRDVLRVIARDSA